MKMEQNLDYLKKKKKIFQVQIWENNEQVLFQELSQVQTRNGIVIVHSPGPFPTTGHHLHPNTILHQSPPLCSAPFLSPFRRIQTHLPFFFSHHILTLSLF